MIKLFISQPMNGRTEEEILIEREIAIREARQQFPDDWDEDGNEVEVLDSIFDFKEGTHPLVYLGESIKLMAEADIVFFGKGWQDARGCVIEHECAKKYGKFVIY